MRCLLPLLILLVGCQHDPAKVEIREIPGPTVYVAIPDKLTAHPPLPIVVTTNPLQCPVVANERRELLRDAYFKLDAIKAIQGTTTP